MYIYTYTCVSVCVCVNICIHIHIYMYMYMYIYVYSYRYIFILIHIYVTLCTYTYVCVFVYIHIYIYTTHTYTRSHTHIYIHIYTNTYNHIHKHTRWAGLALFRDGCPLPKHHSVVTHMGTSSYISRLKGTAPFTSNGYSFNTSMKSADWDPVGYDWAYCRDLSAQTPAECAHSDWVVVGAAQVCVCKYVQMHKYVHTHVCVDISISPNDHMHIYIYLWVDHFWHRTLPSLPQKKTRKPSYSWSRPTLWGVMYI